MSVDIEQMITNCSVCVGYGKKQPSEPLKPTIPLSLPWKKIGTDLFEFRRENYLISVCYRSKFPEVTKMESLKSGAVVEELKRQFEVHGIPAEVVSKTVHSLAAVSFKTLPKSTALNTAPARPITQRPMEK